MLPDNFESRIYQLFQQQHNSNELAIAFKCCKYEYEDIDFAYYAGLKGDTWNKRAIDFIIEGSKKNIDLLKNNKQIVEDVVSKALSPTNTGYLLRKILYLISEKDDTFFPETNEERLNIDIKSAESVLSDLIKIGERLCSNATYDKSSTENSINDFFRDALSFIGYDEVKDQTRHGISKSGREAGEVDILVTKDGKEIAIFEGLKLSSVNTTYIDEHIEKAIINYNALGTATFVIAYVSTTDYESFWNRFYGYLQKVLFPLEIKRKIQAIPHPNASTRAAQMVLSRDGYDFPLYFITFKLLQ